VSDFARVALSSNLPTARLQLLATDARTELYAPGEFVVRQGDSARSCICRIGRVERAVHADAGAAREMARIRSGGLFASSRI